jgi:hypothetical protein
MTKLSPVASFVLAISLANVGCGPKQGNASNANLIHIDLQPHANQLLTDPFHSNNVGNDLAELQQGMQELGPTVFNIQPGIIQLGSRTVLNKPASVTGIEVHDRFSKLHVLHGAGAGGSTNPISGVQDGTVVGQYVLHYDDGTLVQIPIVYGAEIRDWWNWDNFRPVSRGQVAWVGNNAHARRYNRQIRLYAATWDNPHPGKTVSKIDFFSSTDAPCALFCVAMTAERE